MKRIAELIPAAIDAIKRNGIPNENKKVPNEYKGYIDTFGASIVQNGLIPAIIFFETAGGKEGASITDDKEKEGIYKNRNKLMKAILDVILKKEEGKFPTLFEYVKARQGEKVAEKQIRQKVVDAAIAIKLALRTFAIEKKDEHGAPKQ
ncbi:MAG: type III-B CRISPR module-associated protein Cmr5 [Candidatus Omnitrophota bacterium]